MIEQPQVNMGDSTPKYGVYFPRENGKGFLLMKDLAEGSFGQTVLVVSTADGKIYVRKDETRPQLKNPDHKIQSAEYGVSWSLGNAAALNDSVKTATTWEFCNGGTLDEFTENMHSLSPTTLKEMGYPRLRAGPPEAFMWIFIHSMFSVVIRCLKQNVVHNDIHFANIFLHWPTPDADLPEVYLGDFGLSMRWPWESHPDIHLRSAFRIPDLADVEDIHEVRKWYNRGMIDIRKIFVAAHNLMSSAQYAAAFTASNIHTAATTGRGIRHYSAELISIMDMLNTVSRQNINKLRPRAYMTQLEDLEACAERSLSRHQGSSPNILQVCRPDAPIPAPTLWSSPSEMMINLESRLAVVNAPGEYPAWRVCLDRSQFEIREVKYDDQTQIWDLVDVVGSSISSGSSVEMTTGPDTSYDMDNDDESVIVSQQPLQTRFWTSGSSSSSSSSSSANEDDSSSGEDEVQSPFSPRPRQQGTKRRVSFGDGEHARDTKRRQIKVKTKTKTNDDGGLIEGLLGRLGL